MHPFSSSIESPLFKSDDCHGTLSRLLGNLSGFMYRRRFDSRWTMEFVSAGFRDITGYDPHRLIGNASIAFGDLIAPADRPRLEGRIRRAVWHRQRTSVEYRIRTACGRWVLVEDRLTPVFDDAGQVLGIEGVVDLAHQENWPPGPATVEPGFPAALFAHSSN